MSVTAGCLPFFIVVGDRETRADFDGANDKLVVDSGIGGILANFFYSIGYSLEKAHTGVFVYLCNLWNEGKREPLKSFLNHLDVSIGNTKVLRMDREENDIDLVVSDAETHSPILVVEMKVDGHDSLTSKKISGETVKGFQTIVYPKLLPTDCPLLYITIGAGEYFRAPYNDAVRWVRIRELHEGIKAISSDDSLIKEWKAAIANEIDLQDRCFSEDRSRLDSNDYRGRTWNLYFLGHLEERLMESLSDRDIGIDPTVYTVGRGPDTILNFGWSKFPAYYVEINDNGLLNLKVNLERDISREEKEEHFRRTRTHYQDLLEEFDPLANERRLRPGAKTQTVLRFEIGLSSQGGNFIYKSTQAETIHKLAGVLEKFHTGPSPA